MLVAGCYALVLLFAFSTTSWSIVAIWLRSETFAHGFLIIPICLWLVWNQRDRVTGINPVSAPWVAILILPIGIVWLLAVLADVLVIQQLALVAMIVVGIWAILGHQLARALAFPLLFLFFAVPMGEALVPPLMEFTATSTVWMIQQTGVPVYREGLYFALPTGNWSVVEACSGVRYVIASVTLGVLYAYLTYTSLWRRALFILISAIVPVFANTVRAYIIVMLGHLSDMKVATGVDHLIYGWVFFGLVIFVLFWLGSFWREDGHRTIDEDRSVLTAESSHPVSSKLLASTFVALLAAIVWPLLAEVVQSSSNDSGLLTAIELPVPEGDWHPATGASWNWQPDSAVTGQVVSFYDLDGQTLGLYIQYAAGTATDGEVVGSSTYFVRQSENVRVIAREKVSLRLGGTEVLADQAHLVGTEAEFLALSWYRVGDMETANDYLAKIEEALGTLGFVASGSYRIVVVLPIRDTPEASQAIVQQFLDTHGGQLAGALQRASGG